MWFRRKGDTRPPGPEDTGSSRFIQDADAIGRSRIRAEDTVRSLGRGDLPEFVRERIDKQKAHELPWTSTLTVNEWLAFGSMGLKPLGMVMGSCFFHVGYSLSNYAGVWYSTDLPDQERAIVEGRQLAISRMVQEAVALGAHAIVGVRMEARMPGFYGHETEFVALGTAVTLEGLPAPRQPLVCTVSGEDFLKLLRAGSTPIGLAVGACVHYQYTSRQDRFQATSFWNSEVPTYSEAVYHARNQAIRRMWDDARRLGANGVLAHDTQLRILDVEVERGQYDEREDHIVEFLSIGTAIASVRHEPVNPEMVVELHDWQD